MLAGRLILPGRGLHPGCTATRRCRWPAARTCEPPAGSVLYLALIALLALGVATAVRDSAVSIGLVLGLLYLFPVIASALDPHWSRHLQQIGPMSAGLDHPGHGRPARPPAHAVAGPRACSPCGRPGRCWPARRRCASATRSARPRLAEEQVGGAAQAGYQAVDAERSQ